MVFNSYMGTRCPTVANVRLWQEVWYIFCPFVIFECHQSADSHINHTYTSVLQVFRR
jgi:hypothetical protein